MQYTKLTTEMQQQRVEQRLLQLEAEHYEHTLNLAILESSGATQEQIAQTQAMIDVIDNAHSAAKSEDTSLKAKAQADKNK